MEFEFCLGLVLSYESNKNGYYGIHTFCETYASFEAFIERKYIFYSLTYWRIFVLRSETYFNNFLVLWKRTCKKMVALLQNIIYRNLL